VVLIPLLSHAAGYVTETSHEVTASVYRAQYTVTTAPPAAIKVYSRVAEYGSQNWNYNASNGPLATISPTSLNNIFAAEFNFSNLGLVSGKKYVYYLAGGTSATSQLLTNPACFTTTGMVSCTSSVSPTNPTNPSSVLDTGSLVSGEAGLELLETTIQSQLNSTNPQLPNSPPLSGNTEGGQSVYLGGMTVYFKPSDQIIGETSATLKGTVSVQLEMPVIIQVLSGVSLTQVDKVYSPILQPVSSNMAMVPGETKTFTIPLVGLTKGTTYYFLVKNIATGTQSSVLNFTTDGGTGPIPQSALTIYDETTSPYAAPGSFEPVTDTISDKGIVPKCGRTQNAEGTIPPEELRMCTYKDFMQLIANVIQYALIIIGPIIAIVCMYAGAMIIWLNYNSDPTAEIMAQIKKYYAILVRAAIGLFIIMIAWVLVATVIKELGVKPEFVLLDVFSAK
jgi:hypothetical protein